jgi:hypothetical protein
LPNIRTVATSVVVSKSLLDDAPRFDLGALMVEEMFPLTWRDPRRVLRHVDRHLRRRGGKALRFLAHKVEPSWRCPDCRDREAAEWDDD